MKEGPIGIFDSGYGGLTILKEIRSLLPEFDYIYLGDNARAPYGTRSFELVYHFTLQAVKHLFARGCNLVILACNTASAKALRTIQQDWLAHNYPERRVLGVIRPTVEALQMLTQSEHVGLMATPGTVSSHSYKIETSRITPRISITEQACPLLVPLIENGEAHSPGTNYFVEKYTSELMKADPMIDTIILGCTHYPIIAADIAQALPAGVNVVAQGEIVARSLKDYLHRHPEIRSACSTDASIEFLTTEDPGKFENLASLFYGHSIRAQRTSLEQE